MDSAVRKIVTFYQILDALQTNRELTRESVDVALRWGEYCQKFYRESKEKSFFSRLRSVVVNKLATATNIGVLAASSFRPSFEELERSVAVVVMTVLRNPFVSRDLFSYLIAVTARSNSQEEILPNQILKTTLTSAKLVCIKLTDFNDFEVQMTGRYLIELALLETPGRQALFKTGEFKAFLRNKFGYLLKEDTGPEFVIRLLLWLNSDDRLMNLQDGDAAVLALTEALTEFLLNNDRIFNESVDRETLHQLCVSDSRFLKLYIEHLNGRPLKDRMEYLDSLKETLALSGKFLLDPDANS